MSRFLKLFIISSFLLFGFVGFITVKEVSAACSNPTWTFVSATQGREWSVIYTLRLTNRCTTQEDFNVRVSDMPNGLTGYWAVEREDGEWGNEGNTITRTVNANSSENVRVKVRRNKDIYHPNGNYNYVVVRGAVARATSFYDTISLVYTVENHPDLYVSGFNFPGGCSTDTSNPTVRIRNDGWVAATGNFNVRVNNGNGNVQEWRVTQTVNSRDSELIDLSNRFTNYPIPPAGNWTATAIVDRDPNEVNEEDDSLEDNKNTDTYTSTACATPTPIPPTPTPIPPPPTGDINTNPKICTIQSSSGVCPTTVSWTSQNTFNGAYVYDWYGNLWSTASNGSFVDPNITTAGKTYYLYDARTWLTLDSDFATAVWPNLSGDINASPNPCSIEWWLDTCSSTIFWNSTNTFNGAYVYDWYGNLWSTASNGSFVDPNITTAGKTYYLYDARTWLTLDSVFVYGVKRFPPTATLTANPNPCSIRWFPWETTCINYVPNNMPVISYNTNGARSVALYDWYGNLLSTGLNASFPDNRITTSGIMYYLYETERWTLLRSLFVYGVKGIPPTGTITANPNPCTIPWRDNDGTSTITWSTANTTNGAVIVDSSGATFANTTSGSRPARITLAGNTFILRDVASNFELDRIVVTCAKEPTPAAWYKGVGGDIRSDHSLTNIIPDIISNYFSQHDPTKLLSAGVVFLTSTFNLGSGDPKDKANERRWLVTSDAYNSTVVKTSYDQIRANLTSSGAMSSAKDLFGGGVPGCSSGNGECNLNASYATGLESGIFFAGNEENAKDTTFVDRSTSNKIVFGADKDYIFLINGNIRIESNIEIPKTSTAIFLSTGNITVASNVTRVDGIYSANNDFVIDSVSSGNDQPLEVQGNIIVNADLKHKQDPSLNASRLRNTRDLGGEGNVTTPSLQVIYRPDFILNAPELLKYSSYTRQEVAPKQ